MVLLLVLVLSTLGTGCRRSRSSGGKGGFPFGGSSRCTSEPSCREQGMCGTRTTRAGDRGWACYADSEKSCAESVACKERGECHLDLDRDHASCVAKTSKDCLGSERCKKEGACTLSERGTCVASVAGCSRGEACLVHGQCRPRLPFSFGPPPEKEPVASAGPSCRAGDDPDCREACIDEGACKRTQAGCFAESDAACKASKLCRLDGRCSLDPGTGTCVARAASDCAAADVCRRGGEQVRACVRREGDDACADPESSCKREDMCLYRGDCHASQGICVAEGTDCAASIVCKVRGACGTSGGVCVVLSADDCAQSMECKLYGRCEIFKAPFSVGGTCIKKGEGIAAECVGPDCLREGRCLRTPKNLCRTPSEEGLSEELPSLGGESEHGPAGVEVTLDGEHRTLAHGVAFSDNPEGSYGAVDAKVILGEKPLKCAEFPLRGTAFPDHALALHVSATKPGGMLGRVYSVSWTPRGQRGAVFASAPVARLETDVTLAREGATTPLSIDTEAEDTKHGARASLHGNVVVLGCGPRR